jgi:hypothetical protein
MRSASSGPIPQCNSAELLALPTPPTTDTPLPSRLLPSDIAALQKLTAQLRAGARTYGGGAEVVTTVAARSRSLLSVPASDPIESQLKSALADLHTLAGWCCVDSGLPDQARTFFAISMDLAAEAGDGVQFASALWHAGIQRHCCIEGSARSKLISSARQKPRSSLRCPVCHSYLRGL